MKSRLTILMLLLLVLGTVSAASQPYCTDIFNNTHGFVSSALYGPSSSTTYNGLLAIAFLIILAVITALSIIYGIGIGFGVDSFVRFARNEYLESFFNLVLVLFIATSMVLVSSAAGFFSSLAGTVVSNATVNTTGVSTSLGLYTGICNNIISNQVIPELGLLIQTSVIQATYGFFAGTKLTITPITNLLPSFTFQPLAGLTAASAFVGEELEAVVLVISVNIGIILLLFIIYFLFPLYLYLGIVLRSFPWTRAAGGTFIALFIAFYIVFPAIFYAFTTAGTAVVTQISCAGASSTNSSSSTNSTQPCLTPSTSLLSFIGSELSALKSTGSIWTLGFTSNVTIYAQEVAYFVVSLVGLFISFIVSYELLEMLGDVLGAPSLKADKLIKGII